MQIATYVALSRLVAQQREMDVDAANIANASTPGFRAERMLFSDWIEHESASAEPRGEKDIRFTQDRATYRDQQPGTLQYTNNPLDLAIGAPDGFFTVMTAQGPRLTRGGRFTLSATGTVVDGEGNDLLDPTGKPITLSPGDVTIHVAGDGTISSENGEIGRIGVVRATDPNQLVAEGGRLMRADSPTTPVAQPELSQGALEDSNVKPITELTSMMDEMRQFQFVADFVDAESQRQRDAIDKLTQKLAS